MTDKIQELRERKKESRQGGGEARIETNIKKDV